MADMQLPRIRNDAQMRRSSAPPVVPASAQQLVKRNGDRSMFLTSNHNAVTKQIQEIHHPNGRDIDVKPLLQLVEDILNRASSVPGSERILPDRVDQDRSDQAVVTAMLEGLAYVIDRISIELENMLFSKIQLGKVDEHDQMMQEIKKLLSYDKSGGWAVLSRGSEVVVSGHFTTMMSVGD